MSSRRSRRSTDDDDDEDEDNYHNSTLSKESHDEDLTTATDDEEYTETHGSTRSMMDPLKGAKESLPVDDIRVVAPHNLPAGYQLETEINGQHVLLVVPPGGVLAGETFTPSAAFRVAVGEGLASRPNVPVGAWKDSLWDCCRLGFCHATLWNSCCCTLVAAAQVITRLQLTWWGAPATTISQIAIAFQVMCMLIVGYWSTRIFVFLIIAYLDPNSDPNLGYYVDPPASYFVFCSLDDILSLLYLVFMVIVLRNVRSHLRQRYAIPTAESCCIPACEDCCCSLLCPCLTVGQMMRHTAEYETYPGKCCTNTGLPATAAAIV